MILRLSAAAKRCGVDRTTLWRWTCEDSRVHRCLFRRGWYIVERLAALGLCAPPDADVSAVTPTAPAAEARVA